MNLQPHDLKSLTDRGISPEDLESQLLRLRTGFPYLRVMSPATPGSGILTLNDTERNKYIGRWRQFLKDGGSVVKMVPASGAASRMFKELFAFASGADMTSLVETFFTGIHEFAFFNQLRDTCLKMYGDDIDHLLETGRKREIAEALLSERGMNYGQLPKALLLFHTYPDTPRTPLEEHLAEGAAYAADSMGNVHVHFTVSTDHIKAMQDKIDSVVPCLEQKYHVKYDVDMSVQKPSTDTVAVNTDGSPYRDDGELLFRPAGHGALLANLGDLTEQVVFIKNIDNVVPDTLRSSTIEYKQVLGGLLIDTHTRIEHYVDMLRSSLPSRPELLEMLDFLHNVLFVSHDEAAEMEDLELADYLLCKFDRPLRVCGMVRNEGEPGGGPFLTFNPDGTVSPQILESTQLNPDSAPALQKKSTHFNPVDLVCYIHDTDGGRYNLQEFTDPDTGFISQKSHKGTAIKALELPGLWNGAMSDWNTIFVEVPADTFNPVKTVVDLLRPAHKG